jgi:deazaflavin-dependent oxidoreductase (nitroreductase family)
VSGHHRNRLRHVDPLASRGPLYRLFARTAGTRAAGWLSPKTASKRDPFLLRWTGGRVGFGFVLPTAVLETRGAHSGLPWRNAVIYFHDGERVTIIPSKLGASAHPMWLHNLRAHPDVLFGGSPFRAEVIVNESSRARLWVLADRVFPPFEAYRARAAHAGRTIPRL